MSYNWFPTLTPHDPGCMCEPCRQRRASGFLGGLLGAALVGAAQALLAPRPPPEAPPPVDPVAAAKHIPCAVIDVDPGEGAAVSAAASPLCLPGSVVASKVTPPSDTVRTELPDVPMPVVQAYPRCGACKVPYVLRRTILLLDGDLAERWIWQRDCKHPAATTELVDTRPSTPKPKPKRKRKPGVKP